MKKMILLTSALIGFTFAQTGMFTAAGESGMGVWFNHGVYQLDNDDYEGDWKLGFDYMTGVGVEVGLNMMDGAKGLDLGYHHKMEKWNMSVSWSRMMEDDVDSDTHGAGDSSLYCTEMGEIATSNTIYESYPGGWVSNGDDNCPDIANVDQFNYDSDSEGDICDADDDNDGS